MKYYHSFQRKLRNFPKIPAGDDIPQTHPNYLLHKTKKCLISLMPFGVKFANNGLRFATTAFYFHFMEGYQFVANCRY